VQDGSLATEAVVRVPLRMMNRHGLIAGATGTGKTITLQPDFPARRQDGDHPHQRRARTRE
jgi:Helicase HerA-like C-terminal